jgi:hypothetical protein
MIGLAPFEEGCAPISSCEFLSVEGHQIEPGESAFTPTAGLSGASHLRQFRTLEVHGWLVRAVE